MATVTTIEGIGAATARKLKKVGIGSTEKLLDMCCEPQGRERIAREARIDERKLLRLVNHADLMRVKGVGGEFAELLEASGVDSIPELARRDAGNLVAKLHEVNDAKKITRRLPSDEQVVGWIKAAGRLEPMVSH